MHCFYLDKEQVHSIINVTHFLQSLLTQNKSKQGVSKNRKMIIIFLYQFQVLIAPLPQEKLIFSGPFNEKLKGFLTLKNNDQDKKVEHHVGDEQHESYEVGRS